MTSSTALVSTLAVVLVAVVVDAAWTHGWDTMKDQLWVDFYGVDHRTMPSTAQFEFVAHHYAVVSLEKCFAMHAYPHTEDAVAAAAAVIKGFNSNVKIINYFNSEVNFISCYRCGKEFQQNPEWWLKDDSGAPYMLNHDNATRYYDLTQEAVRQFVAANSVNVPNASRLIDGVFADKGGDHPLADMSAARFAAFEQAHHQSLNLTTHTARQVLGPNSGVFANAVNFYHGSTQHGIEVLPFVDGLCFEHFNSFELVDPHTGQLDPQLFQQSVDLIENATRMDKVVLVRGWPGPVGSPIGPLGPSWSKKYGPTPATHEGRAAAAKELLIPTLASYLIVASNTTFLSYDWWYGINDGVTPCPHDPTSCSGPSGWYPEFNRTIGAPLGRYSHDGGVPHLYTRQFEHIIVWFDASNTTNSTIQWN